MHVNPSTIRAHFRRESRRVAVLDQSRTPTPANEIAAVESQSHTTTVSTPPVVSVREQLTFAFYVPNCAPRLCRQTRHELAIARIVVMEKRYAPQLLNWANRRLSVERYKAKQRRRVEELRRSNEHQLAAREQLITTITRKLGMLARRLESLPFADTRTIVGITSEIRRLAANEAVPQ